MRQVIKLEQLRQSPCAKRNPHLFEPAKDKIPAGKIVAKHFAKRSKEKDWIGWNLLFWANSHSFILHEEFTFDKNGRKWRFDYCIPALKLGLEYNGLFSAKSRHTTVTGHTGDTDKLNAAQAAGWRVIQLTPLNYKNLITELNKFL